MLSLHNTSFECEVVLLLQDHCRLVDPALQSLSLKAFTGMLFSRCPGLESFRGMLPQIYRSFNSFKSLVPTYGAIFLDVSMQQTLLVRGYHANATWGFPKGKISCNEAEMACAIREVILKIYSPTFRL